ncbi:MAG TPA: hypothetical protein VMB05_06850, partial [Solirubrobacteraceae bacterium]|nr:hypothetical protein [Solirubrobacteraceae bacterium]
MPDVLDRYGVDLEMSSSPSSHERMIVVGRTGGTAAARVLRTDRTDTHWGRRFEEARVLAGAGDIGGRGVRG